MGVRNPREAKENCAAMKWQLSSEEISIINTAIDNTIGLLPVHEITIDL